MIINAALAIRGGMSRKGDVFSLREHHAYDNVPLVFGQLLTEYPLTFKAVLVKSPLAHQSGHVTSRVDMLPHGTTFSLSPT